MVRSTIVSVVAVVLFCQGAVAQEALSTQAGRDVGTKSLPFPKTFDPTRYLGKWYEAARLPTPVQPAGTLATAEYASGKNEGEIIVKNTAYTAEGKLISTIEGTAQLLPDDPPRMVVGFGPVVPKDPNYFVIHVDKNYQHAVVGTPDRKSLWFLARKVPVPGDTMDSLIAVAKQAGFDTQKLIVGKWKAAPTK